MEDLDSLVKFANNNEIARFMTDQFPHPYTIEDGINFIRFAAQGIPVHIFTIDINRQAVGGIGLIPNQAYKEKMPGWVIGKRKLLGEKEL